MAKRVYLAESDGKTFSSKADAEAHDEKVFAEKKNEGFLEKFAVFLSETDLKMEHGEAEAAAISELLVAIRDNPISFMEVMEVVLPKQWNRKLKSRRGSSAPPTPPKKKAPTKKAATKKPTTKSAPKLQTSAKPPKEKKPSKEDINKALETPAKEPEEAPLPPADDLPEVPRYEAEARENGCWAILENGKELYDEYLGLNSVTGPKAAELLNAGIGCDGWDSLLAALVPTPPAAFEEVTEVPDPPVEDLTPPPPPPEESEDVLTPLPEMPEDGDWRSEDDESPIPPMD